MLISVGLVLSGRQQAQPEQSVSTRAIVANAQARNAHGTTPVWVNFIPRCADPMGGLVVALRPRRAFA